MTTIKNIFTKKVQPFGLKWGVHCSLFWLSFYTFRNYISRATSMAKFRSQAH